MSFFQIASTSQDGPGTIFSQEDVLSIHPTTDDYGKHIIQVYLKGRERPVTIEFNNEDLRNGAYGNAAHVLSAK